MEVFRFVINSILLGVGLAMDAFSVSIVNGFHEPGMSSGKKQKIAGTFAGFQTLMPLIGWFMVSFLVSTFQKLEPFIPWIAFFLLLFIGGKMLIEGIQILRGKKKEEKGETSLTGKTLILQGVATSIDALSVGFTLADYKVGPAIIAALIIGVVTFILCRIALVLGIKVGTKLNRYASLVGGIILIGIGTEILLTHIL